MVASVTERRFIFGRVPMDTYEVASASLQVLGTAGYNTITEGTPVEPGHQLRLVMSAPSLGGGLVGIGGEVLSGAEVTIYNPDGSVGPTASLGPDNIVSDHITYDFVAPYQEGVYQVAATVHTRLGGLFGLGPTHIYAAYPIALTVQANLPPTIATPTGGEQSTLQQYQNVLNQGLGGVFTPINKELGSLAKYLVIGGIVVGSVIILANVAPSLRAVRR